MNININCVSFKGGRCTHQAAPRRWFGAASCIVWLDKMFPSRDPREAPKVCKLQIELRRPAAPPPAQPMRERKT